MNYSESLFIHERYLFTCNNYCSYLCPCSNPFFSLLLFLIVVSVYSHLIFLPHILNVFRVSNVKFVSIKFRKNTILFVLLIILVRPIGYHKKFEVKI